MKFILLYAWAVSISVQSQPRVWTEEELQALPDDGYLHEVVHGKLVMSPKNNFYHEQICMRLSGALNSYAVAHKLGVVLGSSLGCWMQNRNCRAPDISFIPRARLDQLGFRPKSRSFFPGAPDLVIEVISQSNTPREIQERLEDFFSSGTRIAWIIHPEEQFVEVCHSSIDRQIIGTGAFLDGENLLPGFKFPISNLFKEWDWD
jgi:Uma2 family endonuclease